MSGSNCNSKLTEERSHDREISYVSESYLFLECAHENIARNFQHNQRDECKDDGDEDVHGFELQIGREFLDQRRSNIRPAHQGEEVEEKHGKKNMEISLQCELSVESTMGLSIATTLE
jgi:hypothetical protein